jgi:hypothetical protein
MGDEGLPTGPDETDDECDGLGIGPDPDEPSVHAVNVSIPSRAATLVPIAAPKR